MRHLASPLLAALPDETARSRSSRTAAYRVRGSATTSAPAATRGGARVRVVIFGHAGDGHVHANLLADVGRADLAARLARLLAEVSGLLADLGGTLAGEHGDGRLRAPYLERLYGAPYVELCRHVKRAFDPAGILNPGVVGGRAPLAGAALKVGRDAPAREARRRARPGRTLKSSANLG